MPIPSHFSLNFAPIADPNAVISDANVRFTVLTSRLIRLEYSPEDRFVDRPSQVFWYRHQPVPDFQVIDSDQTIEIITEYLHLRYQRNVDGFSANSLSIALTKSDTIWHYRDNDPENLLGTARTLDMISGGTQLEPGLNSRSGWAVVDDSQTLIFNEQSWLEPRQDVGIDLYFFGYGRDYYGCLRDYCLIAGPVPLLPRWVLGNWWSRYWPYTHDDLKHLMEEFQAHHVPLSVCIVDMDWHLVETGRGYSGWTGYTWNRELFPDPPGFINWLHKQELKTALNLHPALGVRPHEEMYPEMAQRLGIDPATEETVEFAIADPEFARAYFELLHHPQEEIGVDFWWIDWQQGEESGLLGLDPLWWLNHVHYYDLSRDGKKRPFIFSRWGGLGNHRYPIGFSGDTIINWESMAFQPYFTATAANVGYGWWSHDIGGHMGGVEEPELYLRWIQFGVFSPIMRLHCTQNPFHERRPWGYDDETFRLSRDAMQLRHALIPYLYTMSWKNATEHVPPIRPMYFDSSKLDEAYHCPQQYTFGSELIAAPFTIPADPDTRLSRQVVWLPAGDWYDFFTGEYLQGDGWHAIYGRLEDIPVFAKAGAIVPLGPKVGWGGVKNPAQFDVHIFAGADNQFTLYEDDGETNSFKRGEYGLTEIEHFWHGDKMELTVSAVSGNLSHIPTARQWLFHIHGVCNPVEVTLQIDETTQHCDYSYDAKTECVLVTAIELPSTSGLSLTLLSRKETLLSRRDRAQERCYQLLQAFKLETWTKAMISARLHDLLQHPALLADYALFLADSQMRALLELSLEVGVDRIRHTRHEELLLLWNNRGDGRITYQLSLSDEGNWDFGQRFQAERGEVPRFKAITPQNQWRLTVDYCGLTSVKYDSREVK